MYSVTVRFYEELNDFLPAEMRRQDRLVEFSGRRSVKDLVESLGVPHVEVDLILVNGISVDFSYIVENGDRISVYPVFERLDITGSTRLRPVPLRRTVFVLDVHLRKLARELRLFGFDVTYDPSLDDPSLARIAGKERRVLLTRDRQLLMRSIVDRGLYVRNTDPRLQLTEILDRLDLRGACRPFTRCLECNGPIEPIDPATADPALLERIPPGVRSWCDDYYRCTGCDRIYWKGSHYDKLQRFVHETLADPPRE